MKILRQRRGEDLTLSSPTCLNRSSQRNIFFRLYTLQEINFFPPGEVRNIIFKMDLFQGIMLVPRRVNQNPCIFLDHQVRTFLASYHWWYSQSLLPRPCVSTTMPSGWQNGTTPPLRNGAIARRGTRWKNSAAHAAGESYGCLGVCVRRA